MVERAIFGSPLCSHSYNSQILLSCAIVTPSKKPSERKGCSFEYQSSLSSLFPTRSSFAATRPSRPADDGCDRSRCTHRLWPARKREEMASIQPSYYYEKQTKHNVGIERGSTCTIR